MTLHINESEVRQLLIMPMAIAAVEEVSRKQAEGSVVVHPRRRFELPGGGFFHYMAAMDTGAGLIAMKLDEGDHLIGVATCREGDDVLLATRKGRCIERTIGALRRSAPIYLLVIMQRIRRCRAGLD